MSIDQADDRIQVLLHYDKTFREDWRFLHRLRVLTLSIFTGFDTVIIGYMALNDVHPASLRLRLVLIIVIWTLTLAAAVTLAWFGSGLNVLKKGIVRIEQALHLFESGAYLPDESILAENQQNWGKRVWGGWGKVVLVTALIGGLYTMVVLMLG
jgi:hypothetical protein